MSSILITGNSGTYDATQFVDAVTWSGEYTQCSRSLNFSLVMEQDNPAVRCDLGSAVAFKEDEQLLFDGFIVSRQKSTVINKI